MLNMEIKRLSNRINNQDERISEKIRKLESAVAILQVMVVRDGVTGRVNTRSV